MRYITPEKLFETRFDSKHPRPEWKIALISFRDCKGSEILIDRFKAKPVGYKVIWGLEETTQHPYVYEAEVQNSKVGIITHCLWGGPQAAILVEELAAMGVEYLIGYGAAGCISDYLNQGDQVAAFEALCNDGTSRMYSNEDSVSPDESLLDLIITAAGKAEADLQPAAAATIDAIYRETPELVEIFRDLGTQIVNMEVAPFYAAAQACDIHAIWIGHISDCLGKEWKDWNIDREEMSRVSADICYESVTLLAEHH